MTDDLRTRAREAAAQEVPGRDPGWIGKRLWFIKGYTDGYLAHAAQQPSREQIAPKACPERHETTGTTHAPANSIACAWSDDCMDAVLALLNGAGS